MARTRPSHGLTRQILSLSLPALGALVTEPIFVLVDSAMVGHLGTGPLAGLALASQAVQTVVVLFIFLAYSTTSLTSRALGAGDRAKAVRAGIDAIWLAGALGVLAMCVLLAGGPLLTYALGASKDVAPHALSYLWTSAPGMIGLFINFAATGTLRGLQDTRTPMLVTVGGTIINIAANAVLIFAFNLGVAGSGLGTTLSHTLMGTILAFAVVRQARQLSVRAAPSWSGMWTAMMTGAPLIVRGVALRLAGLATIWPLTPLGAEVVAAHQVVLSVWTLACFVLDALAIAAQSMVGVARGAGDTGNLRTLLRVLTRWGALSGVALAVIISCSSPWVPAIFGEDETMRSLATWGLLACCVGMPLGGVVFLLDGVLLGAGENRYLAAATTWELLVFLPVLAAVEMARRAGMSAENVLLGVWLAYGLVFMGARTVGNMWRTWFQPSHSLLPRHRPS